MVLVYYLNLNKYTYYYKVLKSISRDYEEGYVNQYEHQIIAIYILRNNKLYTSEEYRIEIRKRIYENKNSFKNRLIDASIKLLNKLKT